MDIKSQIKKLKSDNSHMIGEFLATTNAISSNFVTIQENTVAVQSMVEKHQLLIESLEKNDQDILGTLVSIDESFSSISTSYALIQKSLVDLQKQKNGEKYDQVLLEQNFLRKAVYISYGFIFLTLLLFINIKYGKI